MEAEENRGPEDSRRAAGDSRRVAVDNLPGEAESRLSGAGAGDKVAGGGLGVAEVHTRFVLEIAAAGVMLRLAPIPSLETALAQGVAVVRRAVAAARASPWKQGLRGGERRRAVAARPEGL